MFKLFLDSIRLAPDMGDGAGGGGDDGITAPDFDAGDAGGIDSQQSAPDYDGLAKQYGGYDQMKEVLDFYHNNILQKYNTDPQFRQHLDDTLAGKYGPQAQAQAQQQVQQGQQQQQQPQQQQGPPKGFEFISYADDPMYLAAYQLAVQNGGQLPEDFQNRDQYLKQLQETQKWHDQNFINPVKQFESLLDHPSIQAKLGQIGSKSVQPIQDQLKQQNDAKLVEQYGPHLEKLHPEIKQMFAQGQFGTGEKAAIAAIKMNQLIAGGQPQQPPVNGKPQGGKPPVKPTDDDDDDDEPSKPAKGGKPKSEADKIEQRRQANRSSFGRSMAKAKFAELNGKG